MIRIENVSLAYRDVPILRDITLSLDKGGITALVGPNGAGKSTLFSLIARLQPLQAGRITIDVLPVGTTPSRQLAQRLAILRQDGAVASRLTVRELVGFGRFPHHQGRPGIEDLALVDAALEQFELQALSGRFIDTLSGGQRQRAMVAMTFCHYADRIVAIRDDRVIVDGTPDAVLTEDNLEAIFGYRMQVERMGGKITVLHHL